MFGMKLKWARNILGIINIIWLFGGIVLLMYKISQLKRIDVELHKALPRGVQIASIILYVLLILIPTIWGSWIFRRYYNDRNTKNRNKLPSTVLIQAITWNLYILLSIIFKLCFSPIKIKPLKAILYFLFLVCSISLSIYFWRVITLYTEEQNIVDYDMKHDSKHYKHGVSEAR